MSEHEICPLGPYWRLAADELQWIVEHGFPRRDDGVKWNGVAYVTSQKAVLLRVLREKGVAIDAEGKAALAALPESFRAWHEAKSALHSRETASKGYQLPSNDETRRAADYPVRRTGTNG